MKFSKESKKLFPNIRVRKKRLTKTEKNYLIREQFRIVNTEAYEKYFSNRENQISQIDIKKLFKVDDYTTKKDLEKRILKLLDNFSDQDSIYQIINKYKKEVKKYVSK